MTVASGPLGGHLLHAVPLLVPLVAAAVVLLPDVLRHGWRTVRRRPSEHPPALLVLASSAAAGAAAVHLVVMPEHFEESVLYGSFFVVLAACQGGYAWLLLVSPSRPVLLAGVLGNQSVLLLWLVTRTVGLPLGPYAGQVEPIGYLDLTAVTCELVLVTACGLLLSPRAGMRRQAA